VQQLAAAIPSGVLEAIPERQLATTSPRVAPEAAQVLQLARPMAIAGNRHLGTGKERSTSKKKRAGRCVLKKESRTRPDVARVAKAVCFSSAYIYAVILTGGGVLKWAPSVVRRPYDQDRPLALHDATCRQPGGSAPLGAAPRKSHHTPP
jgi:hypothetical protein